MRVVNMAEVERLFNIELANRSADGTKSMVEEVHDERLTATLKKLLENIERRSYTIMTGQD